MFVADSLVCRNLKSLDLSTEIITGRHGMAGVEADPDSGLILQVKSLRLLDLSTEIITGCHGMAGVEADPDPGLILQVKSLDMSLDYWTLVLRS